MRDSENSKKRFQKSNDYIKWRVLFIDDEIKEEEILEKIAEEVILNNLGEGTIIDPREEIKPEDEQEILSNITDYDIVMIDIYNKKQDQSTKFFGTEKILPLIRQYRGANLFPIIIMLSRIPSHIIAHQTIKDGADYYISKKRFFIQLPYSLIDIIENLCKYFFKEKSSDKDEVTHLLEEFLRINYGITNDEDIEKAISSSRQKYLQSRTSITFYKSFKIPGKNLHRIIKISSIDKIYREKYNYERYIKGNIDNFCGRIEEKPVIIGDRTLIAYTLVGDPERMDKIMNLTDFMKNYKNLNKLNSSINYIFENILYKIHRLDGSTEFEKIDFPEDSKTFVIEEKDLTDRTLKIIDVQTGRIFKLIPQNMENPNKQATENKTQNQVSPEQSESQKNSKDIRTYYRKFLPALPISIPKNDLDNILNNILVRRGKLIYLKNSFLKQKDYIKELQDQFAKKVKEAFKMIEEDRKHNLASLASKESITLPGGIRIINPIFYFKFIDSDVLSFPKIIKNPVYGIIHGDLQPENILLMETESNMYTYWLVDYGETGYGHLFHDYAKLELQIRMMALCDVFHNFMSKGKRLVDMKKNKSILYEEIHYLNEFEKFVASNLFDRGISKDDMSQIFYQFGEVSYYYECIGKIREKAWKIYQEKSKDEELDKDIAKLEYLISLYYLSLNALKYNEEIDPLQRCSAPLPRILALILSANCLEEFLKIVLKKAEEEKKEFIELINNKIPNEQSMRDLILMRLAVILSSLSEREGKNRPRVGAIVLNKEGKIISLSSRKGDRHAEFLSLNKLNKEVCEEGTIYTTLEPCFYRNSLEINPCCYEIMDKDIKRVVIGCKDPNPNIKGLSQHILYKEEGWEGKINGIIDLNKDIKDTLIGKYKKVKNIKEVEFKEDFEEEIKSLNLDFFSKER